MSLQPPAPDVHPQSVQSHRQSAEPTLSKTTEDALQGATTRAELPGVVCGPAHVPVTMATLKTSWAATRVSVNINVRASHACPTAHTVTRGIKTTAQPVPACHLPFHVRYGPNVNGDTV